MSAAEGALGAILLVGGRGTRFGGEVKPLLRVSGQTLLAVAVTALRDAGCAPVVAVGSVLDAGTPVRWVREEPPFGGPVAAIAAGLETLSTEGADLPEWVILLAGDLPFAGRIVTRLVAGVRGEAADAVVFRADGRPQWLAGAYRTHALREALQRLGTVADASCRDLLGALRITWLADDDGITADIDTPADLARVRAASEEEPVSESPRLPPEALDEWALALRDRFGLNAEDVPIGLILDLARDVANGVARPAAPFSAFVAGLVAGRAGGSPEQVREAVAAVVQLAGDWKES